MLHGTTAKWPSRDEVNLFNAADELVASAKWQNSEYGGALHLAPNGSYVQLGEVQTVVELLEQMGAEYSTFLEALKVSSLL